MFSQIYVYDITDFKPNTIPIYVQLFNPISTLYHVNFEKFIGKPPIHLKSNLFEIEKTIYCLPTLVEDKSIN